MESGIHITRGLCFECKKFFEVSSLKKCSKCKAIKYCSVNCQKRNWPDHKVVCAEPQPRLHRKYKDTEFHTILDRLQAECGDVLRDTFALQIYPKTNQIRLEFTESEFQSMLDPTIPAVLSMPKDMTDMYVELGTVSTINGMIQCSIWDEMDFFMLTVCMGDQMFSKFFARGSLDPTSLVASEKKWTLKTFEPFMSKSMIQEFKDKKAVTKDVLLYLKILAGCPCGSKKTCYHQIIGL